MSVRSPFPRQFNLLLALTAFILISTLLFVGHSDPKQLRKIVPTVSWAQPSPAALAVRDLEAKWGKAALRMSLAHGGSGARLQRVLERLKRKQQITVGVLGGSITFGHGLEEGATRWSDLFDDGLRRVYPDANISVVNGAVSATGTDYFSACYEHHVPKDSDLFIIETAVNDLDIESKGGDEHHRPNMVEYMERLVRELRSSPSDPALMMLSAWVVPHGFTNGADRHAVVSEYYDIPRISMRSFLYPYLAQNKDELPKFFGTEKMDHPVQGGHQYMADILLYHIFSQQVAAEGMDHIEPYPELGGSELNNTLEPFTTPPLHIKQHLKDEPYTNPQPFCLSTNVRIDGKAQLQPAQQTGWEETEWNDKHYWTAYTPGSRITFTDIHVHGGRINLFYLRSPNWGLGNMRCWADDAEHKAVKLQGYWPYTDVTVGSAGFVADGLVPGKHSVTCVVLDEKEDHEGVEGTNRVDIIAVLAS